MSSKAAVHVGHQVKVAGAVKKYGSYLALKGIEFDVAPGEFLVLLGPSGSGKSTLIRSVAGIERLDGGEISLSGNVVSARGKHVQPERRNLAMVFQDYALWPHLTAAGNIEYALRRRHLDGAKKRERVQAALDRVGLGANADSYPHELSGGQQQRVALARAVVAEPALLLFDEPLSNLDADLRERLRVEISTVTRESSATAVYITHDQSEAFALADTVGVLDNGSLVQVGRPEVIYRQPATPFVARFTGVAGELVGQVVRRVDDYAIVALDEDEVAIRTRALGRLNVGDPALVIARPEASRIIDEASADPTGSDDVVQGTVIDVAYRGRGYDHVISFGPHLISSVHDLRARQRGERVAVSLDAEHLLAYPRDADDEGSAR